MPSEVRSQVHNNFVLGICSLLVGLSSERNKFDIKETCLEGERAATVENEDQVIHFDILLIHEYEKVRTHYYCECKTRKEYSSRIISDLKRHLKIFLNKAYRTIDFAESRYGKNYGFLFISDVPFMSDNNLTFSYLKDVLGDIPSLDDNKVNRISTRIRILTLSDWFVGLFQR